jgi:hypothetical protein
MMDEKINMQIKEVQSLLKIYSKKSHQITKKKLKWNNKLRKNEIKSQKKVNKRSYSIEICLNVFNGSFIFFIDNGDEKRNK